jgi:hypothetical protein
LLAELARLKQVPLHTVFQQFTIQSLAWRWQNENVFRNRNEL